MSFSVPSYPAMGQPSLGMPMFVSMTMPPQMSMQQPQPPMVHSMPAMPTQQQSFSVPTQTASMPAMTNHANNGAVAFDPQSFMVQRQALASQPLLAPYQQQQQQHQQPAAPQTQPQLTSGRGAEQYGALMPYEEKDPKQQASTQLAADSAQQAMQQSDPTAAGKTREERMYLATVSELSKVIHTKYRASLVHKRAAPETVGFLIHRHCEALRMLGHVAENIIQHTNAILDDPTLQPDHIKETLGGGDEQLLRQACEWVRSLAIIFQKEAITIHFPWYLPQQEWLQSQQNSQQRQIEKQQEAEQRRQEAREARESQRQEKEKGGCVIS